MSHLAFAAEVFLKEGARLRGYILYLHTRRAWFCLSLTQLIGGNHTKCL